MGNHYQRSVVRGSPLLLPLKYVLTIPQILPALPRKARRLQMPTVTTLESTTLAVALS